MNLADDALNHQTQNDHSQYEIVHEVTAYCCHTVSIGVAFNVLSIWVKAGMHDRCPKLYIKSDKNIKL